MKQDILFDACPGVQREDLKGAYIKLAVLSNKFRNGLKRLFPTKSDVNLVRHVPIHVLDWCIADNLSTIDSVSTPTPREDTCIDELYSLLEGTQNAIVNMARVMDNAAISGVATTPDDDDTASITTFETNTLKHMDFWYAGKQKRT